MSVKFAEAVAEGLRHNGVTVRFIDGWDRRGNGQVSSYLGLSWHHTASNYGRAYSTLWNGRAGLSGPLCNSSGDDDGGITIVAAHPANHAGASGGRSMGPLPTTNLFNKLMWGHEIVYPGTSPMTDAQYRSAQILAGVVSGILQRPNVDWCRGHAETSITGKWDPGYANGKTYDLNAMRAGVWAALNGAPAPRKGLFMALNEAEERDILEAARSVLFGVAGKRSAGQMARTVSELAEGTLSAEEKALVVEVVGSLLRGLPGERSAGDLRINLAGLVEQVDLLEAKLCKVLEKLDCGDDETADPPVDDQAA